MLLFLTLFVFPATIAFPQTSSTSDIETTTIYKYRKPIYGGCKLHPNPPHGRYELVDPPFAEPDEEFDNMTLKVICDPGYGISNRDRENCNRGFWSWDFFVKLECKKYCAVPKDEALEYRCLFAPLPKSCHKYVTGGLIHRVPCPIPEGYDKGYRPCKEYEPNGTVVQPVCRNGNRPGMFPNMTCFGGTWDVIVDTVSSCSIDEESTYLPL